MYSDMTPYKVVIHRGGTSKGIFIKENELPKDPEARSRVIRAIFGTRTAGRLTAWAVLMC